MYLGRKKTIGVFLLSVWSAAIAVVVGLFDPFGLSSYTDQYSSNVFYNVVAPTYPTSSRSDVEVILLDDNLLNYFNTDWPLSYTYYLEVTRTAIAREPKVLIFDISFLDAREDDFFEVFIDYLADQDGRTEKIPILLAHGYSPSTKKSLHPLLEEAVHRNAHMQIVSPDRSIGQSVDGYYPIKDEYGFESVAFAAFEWSCNLKPSQRCKAALKRLSKVTSFQVFWGSLPAPNNCTNDQSVIGSHTFDCSAFNQSVLMRLLKNFAAGFWGFDSRLELNNAPPFHAVLPAGTLISAYVTKDGNSGHNVDFILIGSNFLAIDDYIETPIHQQIDGVFLHAMALDNLLALGDRFISEKDHETLQNLLEVLLIWACIFAYIALRGIREHVTILGLVPETLFWVGAALVNLAIAYAVFNFLGVPPVNTLGIISISGLSTFGLQMEAAILWRILGRNYLEIAPIPEGTEK